VDSVRIGEKTVPPSSDWAYLMASSPVSRSTSDHATATAQPTSRSAPTELKLSMGEINNRGEKVTPPSSVRAYRMSALPRNRS
jgi:hypothetical protein